MFGSRLNSLEAFTPLIGSLMPSDFTPARRAMQLALLLTWPSALVPFHVFPHQWGASFINSLDFCCSCYWVCLPSSLLSRPPKSCTWYMCWDLAWLLNQRHTWMMSSDTVGWALLWREQEASQGPAWPWLKLRQLPQNLHSTEQPSSGPQCPWELTGPWPCCGHSHRRIFAKDSRKHTADPRVLALLSLFCTIT